MKNNGARTTLDPGYFFVLDILRGIAAYSVVMLHTIAHTDWQSFPTTGPLGVFRHGDYGVDLFFVLSGFVVFYNLQRISEKSENIATTFFRRRMARIIPLYLLTIFASLMTVQSYMLLRPDFVSHILSHVFFIHNFNIDWFSSIDGVNWTIAIEVQFYILLFVLFKFHPKLASPGVAIAGIAISWLWRYMSWSLLGMQDDELGRYYLFALSTQLPGTLDRFFIGIYLVSLARSSLLLTLRTNPLVFCSFLGLAFAGFYLFIYPANVLPWSPAVAFVLHKTMLAIVFALFILCGCALSVSRLYGLAKPLCYFGTISYGVYLWHLPVILYVKTLDISDLQGCLIILGATTLFATLSWKLMEKPIIRYFK